MLLRTDDKEETVRRRLAEFYRNTDALIDHYRTKGLVKDVSATDPVEVIYQNIVAKLPVKAKGGAA